ncbi:MAG: hypothetical protein JSU65_09015 [Candidatus Zixiibacteriota bacterium]|nr:MAG: hypothetical protein JSU65_09015 [candidate division Zixibacteria bacterium]
MKKITILLVTIAAMFGLFGCEDNDDIILVDHDPAPLAPQGVFSITGDERVTIVWNGLYEDDIVEYVVGWNDELLGEYFEVGRVSAFPRPDDNRYGFVDTDVDNGTTYFYAVWAIDAAGQVSEASLEAVFDTPRPEGNVTLYSLFFQPGASAFDFDTENILPWDAFNGDVYVDHAWLINLPDSQLIFFLNSSDDMTDIQDLGYTEDFDEIDWAPAEGWSDLRYYELIAGHTYVIWTHDYHYAKMRVTDLSRASGWVNFDWAYQTADATDTLGNRELLPELPDSERDANVVEEHTSFQ